MIFRSARPVILAIFLCLLEFAPIAEGRTVRVAVTLPLGPDREQTVEELEKRAYRAAVEKGLGIHYFEEFTMTASTRNGLEVRHTQSKIIVGYLRILKKRLREFGGKLRMHMKASVHEDRINGESIVVSAKKSRKREPRSADSGIVDF